MTRPAGERAAAACPMTLALVLMIACASGISAQGTVPPPSLEGKLSAGRTIFVTEQSGAQTQGRLLRLSPETLTLLIAGQERQIPRSRVGRIERRDSLWNGVLIGAAPAVLFGMAAAGSSCSPNCGRDVFAGALLVGGIGAGLGAAIDAGVKGYTVIDGAPLPSTNALGRPRPVASLDELWRRVRQGDEIVVTTTAGLKQTGRFVQVSPSALTLRVDEGARDIAPGDVRRVTRAGSRYRSGALWGAGIFGLMGVVGSSSCSGGGCGNPAFIGAFMGSSGALWGALIGGAMTKHPVVYEATPRRATHLGPLLGQGRAGVAVTTTF